MSEYIEMFQTFGGGKDLQKSHVLIPECHHLEKVARPKGTNTQKHHFTKHKNAVSKFHITLNPALD